MASREQSTHQTEERKRAGDRYRFNHRHPVDAVHEVDEVHKPHTGNQHERALGPPGQHEQYANVAGKVGYHNSHRDRLQQQARQCLQRPDIVRHSNGGENGGHGKQRRQLGETGAIYRQGCRTSSNDEGGGDDGNASPLRGRDPVRGAGSWPSQRVTAQQWLQGQREQVCKASCGDKNRAEKGPDRRPLRGFDQEALVIRTARNRSLRGKNCRIC